MPLSSISPIRLPPATGHSAPQPGSGPGSPSRALNKLQHLHIHHGLSELIVALSKCNSSLVPRLEHLSLPSLRRITVQQPVLLPELVHALRWANTHSISITASLHGKSAAAAVAQAMAQASLPETGSSKQQQQQQLEHSRTSSSSMPGLAGPDSLPVRHSAGLSELAGLASGCGHCLSLVEVGRRDVLRPEQQVAASQQTALLKACNGIALDMLEVRCCSAASAVPVRPYDAGSCGDMTWLQSP